MLKRLRAFAARASPSTVAEVLIIVCQPRLSRVQAAPLIPIGSTICRQFDFHPHSKFLLPGCAVDSPLAC